MPTSTKKQGAATKAPPERRSESKGKTSKVGNLTRDPELRFTPEGLQVARMGLAVETPVVPGEWSGERTTTFYDLTAFGDMAEHAGTSLTKGMRVVVMGRAEVEFWTDEAGKEMSARKILVDAIGPDLRWATAEVTKVRTSPAAATQAPPAAYDEEPF